MPCSCLSAVARSTTDQINVASVATHFGGGGHERAAAALIHAPPAFEIPPGSTLLEVVRLELLNVLQQLVQPSVTVSQIMSGRPTVIDPGMSANAAANLMQRYGYEGYPVVSKKKILGLLTRRAVDRAISHKMNLSAHDGWRGFCPPWG
jgi:tRNA nucleotidyltransferase (CCA-adding enzyme)